MPLPEMDLYLRKSKVVRSDPRQLLSIVDQEQRGRAWAAANGFAVRRVWVDNLSGWADIHRPQFDTALDAVLSGEVTALWCAYLDRFTRQGVVDIVPILGVARVIFDYEALDSSNPRDRRWIIDRAEQSKEFSDRLSYNIRGTKALQRDAGQWLTKTPWGFDIEPESRKLRNNADWPEVIAMFEWLAEGRSQRGYREDRNSRGIPSPTGGAWAASTVSFLVANPVYEGFQVLKGPGGKNMPYRNAAGECVSILAEGAKAVPPELVRKARAARKGHFAGEGHRPGAAYRLLTGSTWCAACGRPVSGAGARYVCPGTNTPSACAEPLAVRRTPLEAYIRDQWIARLSTAEDDDPLLPAVAKHYATLKAPGATAELREAEEALRAAQKGIQRLTQQQAQGLFDPPFDTHLPALQADARTALEAARATVSAISTPFLDITFLRDADTALAAWEGADDGLRRDFVRSAIKRIVVTRGAHGTRFDGAKRVAITWRDGLAA